MLKISLIMKYGPLPYHTFEIGYDGHLIHKWSEISEPAGGFPLKTDFFRGKKTALKALFTPIFKRFIIKSISSPGPTQCTIREIITNLRYRAAPSLKGCHQQDE